MSEFQGSPVVSEAPESRPTGVGALVKGMFRRPVDTVYGAWKEKSLHAFFLTAILVAFSYMLTVLVSNLADVIRYNLPFGRLLLGILQALASPLEPLAGLAVGALVFWLMAPGARPQGYKAMLAAFGAAALPLALAELLLILPDILSSIFQVGFTGFLYNVTDLLFWTPAVVLLSVLTALAMHREIPEGKSESRLVLAVVVAVAAQALAERILAWIIY